MSTIFTSDTQLLASENVISSFLSRPRNTPSARNGRARDVLAAAAGAAESPASGAARMRAIFSRLGALAQEPARQLAYERMVIEAKIAAVLDRVDAAPEPDELGGTDMLERLVASSRDNDAEIKRCIGSALWRELLGAIASRDMVDALRLSVVSEEEAAALRASTMEEYYRSAAGGGGGGGSGGARSKALTREAALYAEERAARLWRRRLWKLTIPNRASAALRWATAHDDVDRFGNKSLANALNRRDATSELSYYQTSALKYGRSARRRGSTGIAGAWEDVYDATRARQLDRGAPNRLEAAAASPDEPSPPRSSRGRHAAPASVASSHDTDAEIGRAFFDLEAALDRERALAAAAAPQRY
jgi:hypothetical protein